MTMKIFVTDEFGTPLEITGASLDDFKDSVVLQVHGGVEEIVPEPELFHVVRNDKGYWHGRLTERGIDVSLAIQQPPNFRVDAARCILWVDGLRAGYRDGEKLYWDADDTDVYVRHVRGTLRVKVQGKELVYLKCNIGQIKRVALDKNYLRLHVDGEEPMAFPHTLFLGGLGYWVNQPKTNEAGALPHLTWTGDASLSFAAEIP
jgi:hypothetical protein